MFHRDVLNAAPEPPAAIDGERRYISFSLFGTAARYWIGARRNIELAEQIYPGWRVRLYVGEEVSLALLAVLLHEAPQHVDVLVVHSHSPLCPPPTFWRFVYINDDPAVERYIVRDIDSRLSHRERHAVDEWIASGRPFHVMRDTSIGHDFAVVASAFGASHSGVLAMVDSAVGFVKSLAQLHNDSALFRSYLDQWYLSEAIFEQIDDVVMAHDSYSCVEWHAQPFPTRWHDDTFVGQALDENDVDVYGHSRVEPPDICVKRIQISEHQ